MGNDRSPIFNSFFSTLRRQHQASSQEVNIGQVEQGEVPAEPNPNMSNHAPSSVSTIQSGRGNDVNSSGFSPAYEDSKYGYIDLYETLDHRCDISMPYEVLDDGYVVPVQRPIDDDMDDYIEPIERPVEINTGV